MKHAFYVALYVIEKLCMLLGGLALGKLAGMWWRGALAIAAMAMLAGCGKPDVPINATSIGYSTSFITFTHEGHSYIAYVRGGLLHSESCTNSACQPVTLESMRNSVFTTSPTNISQGEITKAQATFTSPDHPDFRVTIPLVRKTN